MNTDAKQAKATLAVGILQAFLREGRETRIFLGEKNRAHNKEVFRDIAMITEDLYETLFPEQELPEIESQIGVNPRDVNVGNKPRR